MHVVNLAAAAEPTGGVAGWAAGLVDRLGGPGAGLAIALENLFPPLPSEVILPLTGFAAGRGAIGLVPALLWTTLGSVVGAAALYGIGRVIGRERMYALWGRLPLVKVADLERTEAWFRRHGPKAVLLGRMVPVIRSLISVPAGVERMRLPVFLVLTALGSLMWNTVLILAGYGLGDRWDLVETYVGVISKAVLAAAALAVAAYVAVRLRGRGRGECGRACGCAVAGTATRAARRGSPRCRTGAGPSR
ncbi:DedA family protein [Streptomyces sp. SID5785]|uniref:DedA family protein n=1 Tax=Streptomyces sp. SID5785 TaxID=2690309 RepID=UPI001361B631|nr:DedA family protein [Streptomyces sp. SID5785]MZD10056.1 DedA family protein [Streptomyces sp. SID5785]